ncbi:MAG: radical SAM protein [Methanomassiliicoccales archaeon]|nr:MAG: radical SAM protein [Methanomassiliicoccales archaeon]
MKLLLEIDTRVTILSGTFCPHLWNGFFVINNGDVYSCCLGKPIRIGNIHQSKLSELANVPSVVEHRRKSLEGSLECYTECNFVKRDIPIEKIPDNTEVDYSGLKRLDLKFGEACNLSCVMCRQASRVPADRNVLDPRILVNRIDVAPFHDIILQGGEPLYIAECLQYMDYLERMGKKYTILTNGLLIDREMAERLSIHANRVIVSLNAATEETHEIVNRGSSFERVLQNIESLQEARKRSRTGMKIIGRMTITVQSIREIPMFIARYPEFGVDYINFGYDKATVPPILSNDPSLRRELRDETTEALLLSNLEEIDTLRLIYLGLADPDTFKSSFFSLFHESV